MQKAPSVIDARGFSLVETLLACAVFALFATAFIGALLYGEEGAMISGQKTRAVLLAEEGIEAARNIKDENFDNLADGAYGLAVVSGRWIFSGTQDVTDIFTRKIEVFTVDADRKRVVSRVTWRQNPQRTGEAALEEQFTRWRGSSGQASAGCSDRCILSWYVDGVCRENEQQCSNHGETYLPAGDQYCAGGSSADTCCCMP